jgi:predicted GNAT family N-acyltransferase
MIENILYNIVKHNSDEYWELVNLRTLVLRKPLKLTFTNEELAAESNQTHFGTWHQKMALASLSMLKVDNTTVKMRQVCTHPNFQGKKIGLLLAQFAEDWAKENNFKQITCHARASAVAFYQKMGYEVISEMFYEVGLEHFKMEKNL